MAEQRLREQVTTCQLQSTLLLPYLKTIMLCCIALWPRGQCMQHCRKLLLSYRTAEAYSPTLNAAPSSSASMAPDPSASISSKHSSSCFRCSSLSLGRNDCRTNTPAHQHNHRHGVVIMGTTQDSVSKSHYSESGLEQASCFRTTCVRLCFKS